MSESILISFFASTRRLPVKPVSMSVRGLEKEKLEELKVRAKKEGVSLNTLVLGILQGKEEGPRQPLIHDDLDRLVGTWSDEDMERFDRAMALFCGPTERPQLPGDR